MIETFESRAFRGDSLRIIQLANQICADYQQQGYNLTLRQIYYQFVARDLLPNSQKSYKRLGSIINDARLCGLMDWSYVQDRTRNVSGSFAGYRDPSHFLDRVADSYIESLWEGQDYRPEVWVEKDALVDIVQQAAGVYRVPSFSCRGYVSQSEMYDAAKRFQKRSNAGLIPLVIHLGDHDPSGVDMTRDITDRLSLMAWEPIEVRRIALTMDQVEQYGPPPNPTKFTDARAQGYIDAYGYESWELDALEPSVLTSLIQDEIESVLDRDLFDAAVAHEQEQEQRIREVAQRFDSLSENWDDVLEVIGDE